MSVPDEGQARDAADDLPRPAKPAPPLFLARPTYRRRRLGDAARLLPVVGAILFFLPILWQPAATPARDTGPGAVYLFTAWALLIVAALVLAFWLARSEGEPGRRAARAKDDNGDDREGAG